MARDNAAPGEDAVQAGRLVSFWHVARWPLFALLVSAALVLGYLGFDRYFAGQAEIRSVSDLTYLTLQLFVLESGSVPESGAPWQLEVARLLAPATTGVAIAAALASIFKEELWELRLRRRSGHIVVCGLGDKGALLAARLLDAGFAVVGVETDSSATAIAELRRRGALVVEGDARLPEVLARARTPRAAYVVALTGTDDRNAEVAVTAGGLAPDEGTALTCLAHIEDPGLCAVLRSSELSAAHEHLFRLDFFNIYELGARLLLRSMSLPATGDDPGLAIIGLTPVGQALVVETARQWRLRPESARRQIHMTLVDVEAKSVADALKSRYPQLEHSALLEPVSRTVDSAGLETLTATGQWEGVFVFGRDGSESLEASLHMRRALGNGPPDIVADLTGSPGLAELLQRPGTYEGVQGFDLFQMTLQPELLLGGTYEILARAIHGEYVAEQRRQGLTAAVNPSMAPWEELPDSLKESNRDQAAHIGAKLAAVDRGIGPLTDWDAELHEFAAREVELLAEMEHARWVEQRLRDGWKLGEKDVAAKRSPYLIDWDQLSEDVKEWDRRAVRGIPAFLARAGYQVVGSGIT